MFTGRDPLTSVPPSRHPFQIWVLAACTLSGFSIIAFGGHPQSLQALMPSAILYAWGTLLMIGGIIGLSSAWWPDRITGLLMEKMALGTIGASATVYAGCVLWFAHGPGVVSAIFLLSIGCASVWRIRQVNRELGTLARWNRRRLQAEAERAVIDERPNGDGDE